MISRASAAASLSPRQTRHQEFRIWSGCSHACMLPVFADALLSALRLAPISASPMGSRHSRQSKPPPSRPLSRLADCEVQLIMRCLPALDLVRFARCNQRLMHAAVNDFAWNDSSSASLLRVFAGSEGGLLIPATRLLRHAGVFVEGGSQLCISVADLGSFCTPLRVRAISATMSLPQWSTALSFPSLHRIHSLDLRVEGYPSGAPLDPLTMLSRRQILALPFAAEPWVSVWSLLPALPALTELHITEPVVSRPEASPTSALIRCAALRHLYWSQPGLNAGHLFRDAFTAESMRNLQSLELCAFVATHNAWGYRPIGPVDFTAACSNLHSLHTLTLRYCFGVDALLVHLPLCPALRSLVIRSDLSDFGSDQPYPLRITPFALGRTLHESPKLVCTMLFPRTSNGDRSREMFRTSCALLEFGPRFVTRLD